MPVPDSTGFYVWQRQWSGSVAAAVRTELDTGRHDLYILGGELESRHGALQWRGGGVPVDVWREPRVSAVLRLPVAALDDVGKTAAAIVARAGVLVVNRIQLDADVPERRLGNYAELVEGIRRQWPAEMGELRLGATFLPCHLARKEMHRVLKEIDEPIIQLHGIDAPKNRDEVWSLMSRTIVFRALRMAKKLDGRFKMALPSYAYVLTFNADGSFRRLYAEGLADACDLPPGTIRELAAPDLDILHEVFTSPWRLPVVWFRLPVRGADRWCLERDTLEQLARGELPRPSVEFTVRAGERTGTVDVVARYRHQIPLAGVTAAFDWGEMGMGGEFFALNGCQLTDGTVHGRLPTTLQVVPFACGEPFIIGKAITSVDPQRVSIKVMERDK